MQYYFKFRVPSSTIHSILTNGGYNRIIFHIDLPSISRGFFNTDVVHLEIDRYISTRQLPILFFDEAKEFFNGLYNSFCNYNPLFLIHYDNGRCLQNQAILKTYKSERISALNKMQLEDKEKELFREIKKYYFTEFPGMFHIPNLSCVIDLKDYEADFLPYYVLQHNHWGSRDPGVLNVILSTDKDLLQTCQFTNVIQCITVYIKKEGKLKFYTLNDQNAISYFYKDFKVGILTSKYVPLMLALAKDKADEIGGIKNVGPATAYKMILKYQLPHVITESTPLPAELVQHRQLIIRNLKLISFEEQMRRIPPFVLSQIDQTLQWRKHEDPGLEHYIS